MSQNQPTASLSARLAERRGDIQYAIGVRFRDALRTAQSHAWQTTPFFWLSAFMAAIGIPLGFAAWGQHTNPANRYGLYCLCGLYVLVALALFGMHIETKHRERKWRSQSHGGDQHPAQ